MTHSHLALYHAHIMTSQNTLPEFTALDSDLQELLKAIVREYVTAKDAEGAAAGEKDVARGKLERLIAVEQSLAAGVDVPDPEGTDREYRVRFVPQGARLDTDKLKENLVAAGFDPDVVRVCWEEAMKEPGKPVLRITEARAK